MRTGGTRNSPHLTTNSGQSTGRNSGVWICKRPARPIKSSRQPYRLFTRRAFSLLQESSARRVPTSEPRMLPQYCSSFEHTRRLCPESTLGPPSCRLSLTSPSQSFESSEIPEHTRAPNGASSWDFVDWPDFGSEQRTLFDAFDRRSLAMFRQQDKRSCLCR